MRTILIIGAGKSTAFLVKYLLDKSIDERLYIRLADNQESNVNLLNKGGNYERTYIPKVCLYRN